jgi:hypothetical protein
MTRVDLPGLAHLDYNLATIFPTRGSDDGAHRDQSVRQGFCAAY